MALLVTFCIALASLAGATGVTVDHGDRPNLGGGHDKFRRIKSNVTEISPDKIQVTWKNGPSTGTDEEPLP